MIFFYIIAQISCEIITSELFITTSFKSDKLVDIHTDVNKISMEAVRKKHHFLKQILCNKMELPGGKGSNRSELCTNLINFSFDDEFKNELNLAYVIYGNIFVAAKLALQNSLKDLINDNTINDTQFINRYQLFFYQVFEEFFDITKNLDRKNIEFNSFMKNATTF